MLERLSTDLRRSFPETRGYHARLKCYVVVELKTVEFQPEHSGKLNFYLSVVDDKLRDAGDNRTIGLILCRRKSQVVAEYALRGMTQPLGISEYELTKDLPEGLKRGLPSVEDLEAELGSTDDGVEPGEGDA